MHFFFFHFLVSSFLSLQITFQFIATFVTLVPLVDCSSVLHERTDLTEVKHVFPLPLSWLRAWFLKIFADSKCPFSGLQVEREMCSASAEFEDFVLQFMDRYVKFGTLLVSRGLLDVKWFILITQRQVKKLQYFKYHIEDQVYTVYHILFNIMFFLFFFTFTKPAQVFCPDRQQHSRTNTRGNRNWENDSLGEFSGARSVFHL